MGIISPTVLISLGVVVSILFSKGMTSGGSSSFRIPAEWEPHSHTCMIWPATPGIWGGDTFLANVRQDIARIAKAIAPHEPVTLIVNPDQVSSARESFTASELHRITILPMEVNDLWARDTLPVFGIQKEQQVYNNDNTTTTLPLSLIGIDLNFNGWGNKQEHDKDAKLATNFLAHFPNISRTTSKLVAEGGSFEFDGEGTLLVTESSVLNSNRNPDFSTRDELEQELKSLFGVEKVVWFKGVVGQDITDAHIDSLVRFASPGVVLLNRPPKSNSSESEEGEGGGDVWSRSSDNAKSILEKETDAKGRAFHIVELFEPDPDKIVQVKGRESQFLASYVNYLVVNGAVIMPQFGDEDADEEARKMLQLKYPARQVVQVNITYLASGGGGIHCATHDVPSLTSGADRRVSSLF